jgi:hypothetical protein
LYLDKRCFAFYALSEVEIVLSNPREGPKTREEKKEKRAVIYTCSGRSSTRYSNPNMQAQANCTEI